MQFQVQVRAHKIFATLIFVVVVVVRLASLSGNHIRQQIKILKRTS